MKRLTHRPACPHPRIAQTESVSTTGDSKSKRAPTATTTPTPAVTPATPTVVITADSARNLLKVQFRGRVTVTAMADYVKRVENLLPQLRAGFAVLTDLSHLESMELDCVRPLTKVMDMCRIHGVRTVVRVVPDPEKDIGFNILAITHYRRGVRVIKCATLAEAERALKA
jgi:hypothetical protein